MATLVLTALGSAIGGGLGAVGAAVGGAIGALAGRSIDALIFRPGGVTGPRLADLQVQTSRYGARIPRLYGTIRVAGTVIWATDLQESSATTGGGKGQPSVTRYSYSASFAVALSARAISGIGRIWADGNLLRGAAGDFKTPVSAFRVHAGGGDQSVDPLIAAAVGPDQAPAYRGCAYAVFEGLQLADFGNRIPSLTFEVMADAGALGLAAIVSDLAGEPVLAEGDAPLPALAGFAADGADLREAIAPVTQLHGLLWRDGAPVALGSGLWSGRTLAADSEIGAVDGRAEQLGARRRTPIEAVPARLSIRHHDPARDYQAGIQSAERSGPGVRADTIDLPVVLDADEARRLADSRLRQMQRGRIVRAFATGWSALDLAVGDLVALEDDPGRWRIEASDWDDMAVRLTLRAVEAGARPAPDAGGSGAPVLQGDLVQGATSLAIVELPPDGLTLAATPTVLVGATGSDAGWRRAALLRVRSAPDGAEPIGGTAPRAVIGTTLTTLPDGPPWRIDRRSHVDVQLDNAADALVPAADDLLLQGANLCQIGEELLLFGEAVPIGSRRYRLSRLVRGWHGTEWASADHAVGERFVLIDASRLASVALTPADRGRSLEVRAIGAGDAVPAEADRLIDGRAMLPPAPVHGRITLLPGGDRAISWVRRSRMGWDWADLGEVPLGEEREAYVLRIVADGMTLRQWEVMAPAATYAAADAAEDSLAAASAEPVLEICQQGTWGLSRALRLTLS
jgi:hypothetical protein